MNPTEQRTRHSVVATIAKRQDNLEIVVEALAKQIVTNRAAHVEATKGTRAACDVRYEAQTAFIGRTFWQRLRWLVMGA